MLIGDQQSALLIFDYVHDIMAADPILPAILDDLPLNDLDQIFTGPEPESPVTVGESRRGIPLSTVRHDRLEFEIMALARRGPVKPGIGREPEVVIGVKEHRVDAVRPGRIAHAKIDELTPHARR